LTEVKIPSGVTSIGEGVFRGCSKLTHLTIRANIAEIGGPYHDVFEGATTLQFLTLVGPLGAGVVVAVLPALARRESGQSGARRAEVRARDEHRGARPRARFTNWSCRRVTGLE
jgi:hypothetical protein